MVHQTAEALICPYTELATSIGVSRTGDVAGWRDGDPALIPFGQSAGENHSNLGLLFYPGGPVGYFLDIFVTFSFVPMQMFNQPAIRPNQIVI